MPKLEPKAIQRELDQGEVWPLYWIYGSEQMKSRELLKRIRKTVLGPAAESGMGLSEQVYDASETSAMEIADAARSLSLSGGTRFIVVREAHLLKDTEALVDLVGPRAKKQDLTSVCVFMSKDLDARKKFSKLLNEKAATVACEEVTEDQREAWIGYLAKRRGLELSQDMVIRLGVLDPWNLDIVDQELEKYSVTLENGITGASDSMLLAGADALSSDQFLDAFFSRKLSQALPHAGLLAENPDESLPLLGLLSWNVRQLALICSGARGVKLNPYVADKLNRWSREWKFAEISRLEEKLTELDFGVKQTPLLPLGLWGELISEFCR